LIDLQHVNVKLLVKNPVDVNLEPLIPIFHRWIKDRVFDELLLDIADYRHVYAGPGIVLIGYDADYSVDDTDSRLGVRYNRKTPLDGDNHERLRQAARATLTACQRLESEESLGGKIRFNGQEIEIFVNDRLLAPNREETRAAVGSEFRTFFDRLFAGSEYSLSYDTDPRKLLSVSAKSLRSFAVADLLKNLDS
jgi:hypothetical protein